MPKDQQNISTLLLAALFLLFGEYLKVWGNQTSSLLTFVFWMLDNSRWHHYLGFFGAFKRLPLPGFSA
ncbi:hypothetical protein PsAD26_04687 [Pseudovibrio sp. Ad26]|nr:hypothetical protein PsAD26_04687 [Pseudovibrio sp. Ad26]